MPRDVRPLEQMRIVGVVDQRDALPGVVLHVEHQRLDLASRGLDGDTHPAGAAQLGLHVTQIDHGGLLRAWRKLGLNGSLMADTLAQFRLFCKCS